MSPYVNDYEFDSDELQQLLDDIIDTFKDSRDDIDEVDDVISEVLDSYVCSLDDDYLKTILEFFEKDVYDIIVEYRKRNRKDEWDDLYENKENFYRSLALIVLHDDLFKGKNRDYIDEEITKYIDSNDS